MVACPECGAERTCQEDFHQMLFWEAEQPALGAVHHLMVLCYHLQHPSLYSTDGLEAAKKLLVEFLENGLSPEQVRKQYASQVDSGQRTWKIKATLQAHGAYDTRMEWTMTAGEVVTGGAEHYVENVRAWARSVLDVLKAQKQI
ncbi:MAG: DUF5946 family protein [Anaerolineae bacterium]|nr:DUF5946 family protein [Anaerolineae bacterium]